MSAIRVYYFHIGDSTSDFGHTNRSRIDSDDIRSTSNCGRDDRTDSELRKRRLGYASSEKSGVSNSSTTHSESPSLRVSVIEHLGQHVGLHTWPSAVVLAEYLWQHRGVIQGRSVIELGAGTGLCGILCAKLGAQVTLTDAHSQTQVLSSLHQVAELNGFSCRGVEACSASGKESGEYRERVESGKLGEFEQASSLPDGGVSVESLTWGDMSHQVFQLPPADVIIGADVLYDASAFDPLLSTVHLLLGLKRGSVFITAYQARSTHASLNLLMQSWGLTCVHIPSAPPFLLPLLPPSPMQHACLSAPPHAIMRLHTASSPSTLPPPFFPIPWAARMPLCTSSCSHGA
ncbi:unnamed protein product [Closterium sp. Naga37s-1]|nr:unnamed protein product [Closterium sp. Naga37s-1]